MASYSMLTVTWWRSDCCVPSGLNFEAAGGFIVHYCLSNYLLRGHQVTVNMTWPFFWHSVGPTPLFGRLVWCSTYGRFLWDYSICKPSTSLPWKISSLILAINVVYTYYVCLMKVMHTCSYTHTNTHTWPLSTTTREDASLCVPNTLWVTTSTV